MLILAGVAISVLTDNGGLFQKTISAKQTYEREAAREKLNIKLTNLNLKTIFDSSQIAELNDLLKWTDSSNARYYDSNITDVVVTETEGIIKMDGYEFNLNSDLEITHIDGSLLGAEQGPVSAGTSILPGKVSSITVKYKDTGMVPVTYNTTDSSWYVATKEQVDNGTWFNYVDTSEPGQANKSQWANVMLRDNLQVEGVTNVNTANLTDLYGKKITSEGSMFVWIPRYAYKIESGYHTDQAGRISVKFLNTNNTYKDGSSTSTLLTNPANTLINASNSYLVHPAFSWAKEDGTPVELEGIWIGKFEASSANASYAATQAGNVTTTSSVILRTIGNVSSWRSINRHNIYLNCYNMNSATNFEIYGIPTDKDIIDPHLIKNIEWGAAAYLAQSVYGRNGNGTENDIVTMNASGDTTGNGNYKTNVTMSTTGNVYGIYDMAGGAWEHTAAYVDSTKGGTVANTYLTSASYGKALYEANAKYKDVYVVSEKADDRGRNYSANANKYGDGIYETSYTSYGGSDPFSWYQDYSVFTVADYPFFYRGGHYSSGVGAGIFSFADRTGGVDGAGSFRAALTVL